MVRQAHQAINAARTAIAVAMVVRRSVIRQGKPWATGAVILLLVAQVFRPAILVAQSAIKLATVVPVGSVWDKNLKQMAEEWSQATGGRVTVTVYAGGQQGDESTVLRKMRIDAVQAAAFTSVGLGAIDFGLKALNDAFDAVIDLRFQEIEQ